MADLETTASIPRMGAEFEFATASTPLHRAAGRLRSVLPPGWRVEVVDTPTWLYGDDRAPILRVVMPPD